jgi:hypothetical protein
VAMDVEDSLKLVDLLNGQFAVLNAAPFRLTMHIAESSPSGRYPLSRLSRGCAEHAPCEGARPPMLTLPSFLNAGSLRASYPSRPSTWRRVSRCSTTSDCGGRFLNISPTRLTTT